MTGKKGSSRSSKEKADSKKAGFTSTGSLSRDRDAKGLPVVGEKVKVKKTKEERGSLKDQAADWWYRVLDWFEEADLKKILITVLGGLLVVNFFLSTLVVMLLAIAGVAAVVVGGVTLVDETFAIRLPNEITPAQLMVGGCLALVLAIFCGLVFPDIHDFIGWFT